MQLVAVVLNWNGGDDTLRALESLAGIETICVDNGSTDGSDAEVERRFPEVELIRTGENLGFAGGNNAGIRRALERGADWVLLLNNDAVAGEGIAGALERAAAARPDAGLLACKIYVRDDVLEYAGADFHPLLGYSGRVEGHGRRDDGRWDALRDVGRADGAAMAVSREAVERAGLAGRGAVRLRRGRRVVAADPRRRPRRRLRPGREGLARGLRLDRRRSLDREPLLRHAQHDRRLRAAPAAAARAARAAARRRGRRAPRAGGAPPATARGGRGGARGLARRQARSSR